MELKRKIYQKLIDWKKQEGKTALLLKGARRVGKSFIVEKFAKENYRSYLLIDFSLVDEEVERIFLHNRQKLDDFFLLLKTYYSVELYDRASLIIFDEVQRFPTAREFIKALVKDGRYDYIETGSLLSIKQNVDSIVIPSEEESLTMQPMDFEEFLWALGDEVSFANIKVLFEQRKPVGEAVHRKMMLLFRQYLLVGGMPQAVLKYLQTKDFSKVDKVKRNILKLYREDVARYAKGYEDKVRSIFDSIVGMLSSSSKKMVFSNLGDKSSRFRDYETSFLWLSDAMVTNDCYLCTDPNVGLSIAKDSSSVKCYMADTGLLVTMMIADNEESTNDFYKQLLFGKLSINEGMLMENAVAQMLRASGHSLFFYEKASKDKEERMEIDFLISKGSNVKMKLFPIEVKSGRNYTYSSLDKFKRKFSERIGGRYLFHDKDLQKKEDILLLPLYMAPFV